MRQPAQARGTWRDRGGAGRGRANAAARARGPEIVPPEVLAGPPKRGAAPSNIGARANFCAGRAPDGPGKQSHSRQGAAAALRLVRGLEGEACLLARKDAARAQE